RQKPDGKNDGPGNKNDKIFQKGSEMQQEISRSAQNTGRCINFLPENNRDLVTKNIPDYTSKTGRHSAQRNADYWVKTCGNPLLHSNNSKKGNPDSIKQKQRFPNIAQSFSKNYSKNCGAQNK